MSGVAPAPDADAATWLFRAPVDWWDLVRYGPPGLAVYVRVSFAVDPAHPTDPHECDVVGAALDVLGGHTTSTTGFAAVWEGWGGRNPAPAAPLLDIPNRRMLLFTGPVDELRFAPSRAWHEEPVGFTAPHLAWPADHAWCFACEVDEDIAFTVGCSPEAADALMHELPVAVRVVPYGADEPLYGDS